MVVTLGLANQRAAKSGAESNEPLLANQSVLLLLVLTNHCCVDSVRNPYREAFFSCIGQCHSSVCNSSSGNINNYNNSSIILLIVKIWKIWNTGFVRNLILSDICEFYCKTSTVSFVNDKHGAVSLNVKICWNFDKMCPGSLLGEFL